jgi:hypothetical protein
MSTQNHGGCYNSTRSTPIATQHTARGRKLATAEQRQHTVTGATQQAAVACNITSTCAMMDTQQHPCPLHAACQRAYTNVHNTSSTPLQPSMHAVALQKPSGPAMQLPQMYFTLGSQHIHLKQLRESSTTCNTTAKLLPHTQYPCHTCQAHMPGTDKSGKLLR